MARDDFPTSDRPKFGPERQKAGRSNMFSTRPPHHLWPDGRRLPTNRSDVQLPHAGESEVVLSPAGRSGDDALPPWMRGPTANVADMARGTWPPSAVVREDRGKATFMWTSLVLGFTAYVVYLCLHSWDSRQNPPVQILRKEEPFKLPDIVLCPGQGDGCDATNGRDCLPMDWYLSALEGFANNCNKYFSTPSPAIPTPSPSRSPTTAPALNTPTPTGTTLAYNDDLFLVPSPPPPSSTEGGQISSSYVPPPETPAPTPPPVVLPAINISLQTTAQEWCPRVPLSECEIDDGLVASGDVRSLHASFYVLWNDVVSLDAVSSARRFVNVFFVDQDVDVTDAVVAVRLPYDRVNITGTDPFTFLSNDVILSMSQYVHLNSNGGAGSTERTFTQATTTAQHTLRLDTFDGEAYEGALLYVTLSVNNFAFQSIEEVDPVDWWALLGSAGGMWEIICVIFGACFVASELSRPDKKWGWKKGQNKAVGEGGSQEGGMKGRQQSRSDHRTSSGDGFPAVISPIPAAGARPSA